MDCPNCKYSFQLSNMTKTKWVNVWGGKFRCPSCKSWIRRDKRTLILTNFSILAAVAIIVAAFGSPQSVLSLVGAVLMAFMLLFTISKSQNFEVFESGDDT